MPKKRKSGGRTKGKKGKGKLVQCSSCGSLVPVDKAKRHTTYYSPVNPMLARELRKQGTYVAKRRVIKYYCISCAVHRGAVKIRSKDDRKEDDEY
ncbi:MAG: 30S ribosomal protein S26e [Candidatus Heimdallarchaeota archaeon]|nr:30S ribosomal protein S26e [Candidatus Heimdallarchaeota archaeon]